MFCLIPTSCDSEPEIITETITELDTIFITTVDSVFINQTDTIIINANDTDATTLILVRHAEKISTGTDPELTEEGIVRSNELTRILSQMELNAVYSSDFNRTKETAEPTALAQNLNIDIYNASNLVSLKNQVLNNHKNGKILVVGHSNTTPDFINLLLQENVLNDIPESEYDNLFILTLYEEGNGELLELKYGEPSN